MLFSWWAMDLTVERIIGWCATRGVAHGEKVATSECNGMVKAMNLAALTAVPRMVMHARGIQLRARIVENVRSSPPPRIQRVCVRLVQCLRLHHQCRRLHHQCRRLHHRRQAQVHSHLVHVLMLQTRQLVRVLLMKRQENSVSSALTRQPGFRVSPRNGDAMVSLFKCNECFCDFCDF